MAAGRGLRILLGTLAVGVVLVGAILWLRPTGPALAADFSLVDLDGKTHRLSALRGKVVLVNVWTTWCPPCRDEMPSMQRLYEALGREGLELLAVSEDEGDREAVVEFARGLGVTFPVLLDPQREVGRRYGVWGYPETFVVDREGRMVERVIGPRDWDAPEHVASLRALLSSSRPATGGGVPGG